MGIPLKELKTLMIQMRFQIRHLSMDLITEEEINHTIPHFGTKLKLSNENTFYVIFK